MGHLRPQLMKASLGLPPPPPPPPDMHARKVLWHWRIICAHDLCIFIYVYIQVQLAGESSVLISVRLYYLQLLFLLLYHDRVGGGKFKNRGNLAGAPQCQHNS